MPRVEFSEENKVATTNYDFPKLKLKKDEKARIMAGLEAPVQEYVHTLRSPAVENGQPVMIQGQNGPEYKMNFISRPLCLGDQATLAKKGSDPQNCPICKLAQTSPDQAKAPESRYAMHVIRYKTKSGSWEVQTPFSVELLVWAFTAKTFNKIADIKKEFESLQKHDLTLECKNETFQQIDISVGAKSEWNLDAERKALVVATFKENQIPDLSIAAGSRKERKWVEDDLAKITSAWSQISGAPSDGSDTSGLDEGLDGLLNGGEAAGSDENEWAVTAGNEDDIFAGLGGEADTAADLNGTGPAAAADDEPINFDDLLGTK